mgnify:CR=1 FL=1
MGLIDRIKGAARHKDEGEAGREPRVRALPDTGDTPPGELPLKPESRRLREEERAHIESALAALEAEGVDVDDLESVGAGLDRALALYRSYRPGVPVSRAKVEVWKILERQYVEVEPAPEIPYIFCE